MIFFLSASISATQLQPPHRGRRSSLQLDAAHCKNAVCFCSAPSYFLYGLVAKWHRHLRAVSIPSKVEAGVNADIRYESLSQSKNIGYRQQIRTKQQDIILLTSVPLSSCYLLDAAAAPTIDPPLSSPACPSFFGKMCALCVSRVSRCRYAGASGCPHAAATVGEQRMYRPPSGQTLSISGQQEQSFCHITLIFSLTADSDFIGRFTNQPLTSAP